MIESPLGQIKVIGPEERLGSIIIFLWSHYGGSSASSCWGAACCTLLNCWTVVGCLLNGTGQKQRLKKTWKTQGSSSSRLSILLLFPNHPRGSANNKLCRSIHSRDAFETRWTFQSVCRSFLSAPHPNSSQSRVDPSTIRSSGRSKSALNGQTTSY